MALLAAPALLAAACGPGVHDLSIGSTPILVVHGHVDQTQLQRVHPEAALLGVLVWAAPASVNPVCVRFDDGSLVPSDPQQDPVLAGACPDPYGVFPGEAEAWAPIGADGTFDLPLYTLPEPNVSVGDAYTRIAYGALVVDEDVNGDGQPPFARTPVRGGERRMVDNLQTQSVDRIVASTFSDLHAPQQRIVFREGGFVTPSYFYPAPGPGMGCEPPPAFSVMTAPPYADPAVGTCTFDSTDTRLEVPPLAVADGTAFLCRAVTVDPTVTLPETPPDGDTQVDTGSQDICFGSNVLATVVMGPTCPVVRSFALSGCQQDPLCAMPEWTKTAASLSGWYNGTSTPGWPCP